MRIDILTLFPEMFAPLKESIIGRAKNSGKVDITATTEDGRKSDVCHLQVYVPVTAVAIKPEPDAMYVGQNEVVNGQWLPKNATNTMCDIIALLCIA